MTNAEIIAAQLAARAAADARKTIMARLFTKALFVNGADAALLCEAARHIKWYQDQLARARKDAIEEQREAYRSAGAAYSDGRHDGLEEARGY